MANLDPTPTSGGSAHPALTAQANELRTTLQGALESLSPDEHEAVALCVLGGLSHASASEVTGVNVNTIKARVRRGLEHLRKKMKGGPGSVEAFLALPALPLTSGSLDASVARWAEGAKAGAAPLVNTSVKGMLAAGVLMAVLGTAAFLLVDYTRLDNAADTQQVAVTLPAEVPDASDAAKPVVPVKKPAPEESTSPPAANADYSTGTPKISGAPVLPAKAQTKPIPGTNDLLLMTIPYPDGSRQIEGTAIKTPAGWAFQGRTTSYFPTGERRDEGECVAGQREGHWTGYFEGGTKSWEGDYLHNDKQGLWQYYHENGNLRASGEYFHGKKSGTWLSFYADGAARLTDQFVEGRRTGLCSEYDDKGRLEQTTQFVDDVINGKQILYNPVSQQIIRETQFVDGKKHGLERLYDLETGQETQVMYDRGVALDN